MKQTRQRYPHLHVIDHKQPLYPNAADQTYFSQKALDVMTAIVSGIGFVSAMLFLATLS